jgi:uncharacterized protein YkwD
MVGVAAMMAAMIGLSPLTVGVSETQEQTVSIAFVNPQYPKELGDEARALAGDVNAERAKLGLAPLERDAALDRFARAKAVEMAARGYFGHTDPDGVTFQDRLRAWHWPTSYAAENIALDWDEQRAHAAFMNSPPHARNVLDPKQRRVGIAVVTVGEHQTFYVEDFSG